MWELEANNGHAKRYQVTDYLFKTLTDINKFAGIGLFCQIVHFFLLDMCCRLTICSKVPQNGKIRSRLLKSKHQMLRMRARGKNNEVGWCTNAFFPCSSNQELWCSLKYLFLIFVSKLYNKTTTEFFRSGDAYVNMRCGRRPIRTLQERTLFAS